MEESSLTNAIIPDTNVLVHDPKAVDYLREGGNILIIPLRVIFELDGIKNRPIIGRDASEALSRIEELHDAGSKSLVIARQKSWENLKQLDRKHPDHEIIATAAQVAKENRNSKRYKKVKLLSRDNTVRLLAREFKLGLSVENYHRDETEETKNEQPRSINVPDGLLRSDFAFSAEGYDDIRINEGVVCYSSGYPAKSGGSWDSHYAAIRKEEHFEIIPRDISAFGLSPISLNGNGPNWSQYIALAQLLDQRIELVFLQGGAGTGKTLLALAAALEQRRLFRSIIITRPMVHLEDEDRMGFLPGDMAEKMDPWLQPIKVSLDILRENKIYGKKIEDIENTKKISYWPLDYFRGMTFHRAIIIVDEAQNLTPHQMKTIVTRAGMGTKMIFTGDLGQIDRRRLLDRRSSGLNYAINRLRDNPLVGITIFRESVRSPLAKVADDLL